MLRLVLASVGLNRKNLPDTAHSEPMYSQETAAKRLKLSVTGNHLTLYEIFFTEQAETMD